MSYLQDYGNSSAEISLESWLSKNDFRDAFEKLYMPTIHCHIIMEILLVLAFVATLFLFGVYKKSLLRVFGLWFATLMIIFPIRHLFIRDYKFVFLADVYFYWFAKFAVFFTNIVYLISNDTTSERDIRVLKSFLLFSMVLPISFSSHFSLDEWEFCLVFFLVTTAIELTLISLNWYKFRKDKPKEREVTVIAYFVLPSYYVFPFGFAWLNHYLPAFLQALCYHLLVLLPLFYPLFALISSEVRQRAKEVIWKAMEYIRTKKAVREERLEDVVNFQAI